MTVEFRLHLGDCVLDCMATGPRQAKALDSSGKPLLLHELMTMLVDRELDVYVPSEDGRVHGDTLALWLASLARDVHGGRAPDGAAWLVGEARWAATPADEAVYVRAFPRPRRN